MEKERSVKLEFHTCDVHTYVLTKNWLIWIAFDNIMEKLQSLENGG